jgi:hypothetical protein
MFNFGSLFESVFLALQDVLTNTFTVFFTDLLGSFLPTL